MARRNGIAEDLFKITATLPWWMGIALAVAVYVLLQPYAVLETPIQAAPGQISRMVAGQMGRTFAYYGQYILPLLFLSGALASFSNNANVRILFELPVAEKQMIRCTISIGKILKCL